MYNGAQTYALTGSLGAAFRNGAISYATASAFQKVGAHFDGLDAGAAGEGLYNFGGNYLTSGQVASQIFTHAAIGGVSSVLQGGKFGHGFFSAGVTKGIGGTASKISGGKFANGASTGAFQYLFNQVGESLERRLANPEEAEIIQKVRALAQEAADEWDSACAAAGNAPACSPRLRGTHIHNLFAIKINQLGPDFAAEVSYLDGIQWDLVVIKVH